MKVLKPSVNIIGVGKLGLTLAIALKDHVEIKAITAREKKHLAYAQKLVNSASALLFPATLPYADITFITTNDDSIANVASSLTKLSQYKKNAIMVHCSGLLTSQVLQPLKDLGYSVGSIHPFRSFAKYDPKKTQPLLKNCPCFIEGDSLMVTKISKLFKKCGAQIYPIKLETKTKHHLAAVLAANHLITLLLNAQNCLQANGLKEKENLAALINLIDSTLNNLKESKSLKEALTGPIIRGDKKTLEQHFSAIKDSSLQRLYIALSLAALEAAPLAENIKAEIMAKLLMR